MKITVEKIHKKYTILCYGKVISKFLGGIMFNILLVDDEKNYRSYKSLFR